MASGFKALGIAVALLALVAVAVWDGGRSSELEQQVGITTPGMQVYEVPESGRRGRRARGRTQDLATLQSKAQVAMGAVGGSDGRWPVPPAPPPTWMRGGNSWVYDHTYGVGQRPTTGVWGPGVLPKTPAPAAQDEVVEEITEPDGSKEDVEVPASEVVKQEEESKPDFAAPPAPAPAPAPAPVVEEVVTPSGKTEEVEVVPPPPAPPAAAPAAAAPAAAAPPPPAMVEEEVVTPSGQKEEVMVPAPPAPAPSVVYVQPPTMQQPYAVPIPAPASNQLPLEWAAEDAAEHAYNLAQWRVKILKAKNDQAMLRKKLMEVSMGETPSGGAGDMSKPSGAGKKDAGGKKGELLEIKKSLLSLAKETVGAIKGLKEQMEQLRKAQCCGGSKKMSSTQELSQVGGGGRGRRAMVMGLKKKMDGQLDALMTKVTKLIKQRKHAQ